MKLTAIERDVIAKFGLTLEKLKKKDYPNLAEVATFCMHNGYHVVYDKLSAFSFLKQIERKLSALNKDVEPY